MGHVIALPRDNHRAAFRGRVSWFLPSEPVGLASNSTGLAAREDIAMYRGTLALAIAFSAGLLACGSGAGNNGTSNTGGVVGTGGVAGAVTGVRSPATASPACASRRRGR